MGQRSMELVNIDWHQKKYSRTTLQGAKKVIFTACHSDKLKVTFTLILLRQLIRMKIIFLLPAK